MAENSPGTRRIDPNETSIPEQGTDETLPHAKVQHVHYKHVIIFIYLNFLMITISKWTMNH